MRKFVVGDIRGDIRLLKKLLDRISPSPPDVVLFLGSYLGPGQNSKETVEYLLGLRQKHPDVFLFLRGCYEYVFSRCLSATVDWEVRHLWEAMAGRKVMQSYAASNLVVLKSNGGTRRFDAPLAIPEPHLRFIEHELHSWFEDDLLPFVACHAGAHPALFGKSMTEELAVFGVNDWWKSEARLPGKDIVFSHIPFEKPFVRKGKIGIDLGAGLGGKLCAWEAYTREFIVVG